MLSKDELNALKPGDLMVFEVVQEDESQPKKGVHVSLFVGTIQRYGFVDFDLQPIYEGKMYRESYFLREDMVMRYCKGKIDGFLSEERKASILEKSESQRANVFNKLVKDTPYLQTVLSNPKDSIIHPSEFIKETRFLDDCEENLNSEIQKDANNKFSDSNGPS